LVHNAARINAKASKWFLADKVSGAVRPEFPSDAALRCAVQTDAESRR
jgi:hypothetical protein